MLNPLVTLKWRIKCRRTAPHHFQLKLDPEKTRQALASAPQTGFPTIRIEGQIVRRFSIGWRLWLSRKVSFLIVVMRPHAMRFFGPPCIEDSKLAETVYLETYLNLTPVQSDRLLTKSELETLGPLVEELFGPENKLIAYQFKVLEECPTIWPVMNVGELKKELASMLNRNVPPAKKWWEFSKNRASDAQESTGKAGRTLGLELPPHRQPRR